MIHRERASAIHIAMGHGMLPWKKSDQEKTPSFWDRVECVIQGALGLTSASQRQPCPPDTGDTATWQ